MWQICERLYLGDYLSADQALRGGELPVAPAGSLAPFAGVVSLCPMPILPGACPDEPVHEFTEWLYMPIMDGGNGEEEFEAALGIALPFVRRRMKHGNVLVHCAAGMSRSVSLIAALLCEMGASVEDAYQAIARAKAVALTLSASADELLIAPATEFRCCLARLYPKGSERPPN